MMLPNRSVVVEHVRGSVAAPALMGSKVKMISRLIVKDWKEETAED
jgi:hypothetical protein